MFKEKLTQLKKELNEEKINVSLITDEDSIYYFTGYYNYLHMDFGRPTILIVTVDAGSYLITPKMEHYMAESLAQVDKIFFWNDGMGKEWREKVPNFITKNSKVGYEPNQMPPIIQNYLFTIHKKKNFIDIAAMIEKIRMIK